MMGGGMNIMMRMHGIGMFGGMGDDDDDMMGMDFFGFGGFGGA